MRLDQLSPESLLPVELKEVKRVYRKWVANVPEQPPMPALLPTEANQHLLSAKTVTAHVEMYGGAGVGANAGGVRCANISNFQLKGIGSTQLAGLTTDKWHKHGAMSLQDGVKESLTAELFSAAAPYGAIRCFAVYELGFRFATEAGIEMLPSSAPQAVMVREPAIRLAHFMRSPYLNAGIELAHRDVSRMRTGIPQLVNWLMAGAPMPAHSLNTEAVANALARCYGRVLHQVATLRAKRLIHGSLIPSNISLDGRLLDFTTSTSVSTLHPTLVALGGYASDDQHIQVLESFEEVLFYISKFDPRIKIKRPELTALGASIRQRLIREHGEYLADEHLSIFGFSNNELQRLPRSLKDALLNSSVELIVAGENQLRLYFGADDHAMRPQEGRNDIFAPIAWAIFEAAGRNLVGTPEYQPDPDCFGVGVLARLRFAYVDAQRALDREEAKIELTAARLIRAMQRNADLSPLYRRILDGEINAIVESDADINSYLNGKIQEWRNVFYTPSSGDIFLQGWLTSKDWKIDANNDFYCNGKRSSVAEFSVAKVVPTIRSRHKWLFDAIQNLIQ